MAQLLLDFEQPIERRSLEEPPQRRFGRGRVTGWERITAGTEATPQWVTGAIRRMERGDVSQFVLLAQRMEERFSAYSGALQELKDGMGSDYRVTAASPDPIDQDIAESIERIVEGDAFLRSLVNLRDALGIGYAVLEVRWQMVGDELVPVQFVRVPPDSVRYANDGCTPFLFDIEGRSADAAAHGLGGEFTPLSRGRFISHVSRVRSGLPVNVGMAKSVAYLYLYATMAWQSWGSYLERYGNPMLVGRYPGGVHDDHAQELEDVLERLANDASAVFDNRLDVSVLEHTAAAGNANGVAFRDIIKELDGQAKIAVVGSDMTSTGSGSRALGEVLQERTIRRITSFAFQESATLREQLVAAWMEVNVPDNLLREPPMLELDIEGNEDMKALGEGLGPLLDRGAQVLVTEVLNRAGLPVPEGMDETLMMHAITAEPDATTPPSESAGAVARYSDTILRMVDAANSSLNKRGMAAKIRSVATDAGFVVTSRKPEETQEHTEDV